MKHLHALTRLAAVLASCSICVASDSISLSGKWQVALDPANAGVDPQWLDLALKQTITLPGALQNQGLGNEVTPETKWTGDVGSERWLKEPQYEKYRQRGNVKIPFFLQPEKHYVGSAWFQRELRVPAAWRGKRLVLKLERTHWRTSVWVDGRACGSRDSLGTPHLYDLGTRLEPGSHTLTLRINNEVFVDIGSWSHSVSDHTQGNWNGVIGAIEVFPTSPLYLDDIQAFPNVRDKSVRLRIRAGNSTGADASAIVTAGSLRRPLLCPREGATLEVDLPLGPDAELWDEFNPALQHVNVTLESVHGTDERTITFGLREITATNRTFKLNDQPVFFRGTLECCIFPLTGYPPTDVASWKRIIRICKNYGLNHMRFHSWCPPEAAFVAADEEGFYFQVECGVWTNPGETEAVGNWIYAESERIVQAYGNHPSFLLFTHGNEPHGKNREEYLAKWVNFWKTRDPRRLVTSGSAYPQIPENQYHVHYPCRGPHGWLGKDYQKDVAALEAPVIVHEMGQWCVFPNLDEMRKYTGPLKPKNFEIFRESLATSGMLHRWKDFLRASGKLQVLCYKEEVEAAMRTDGISGFQLLDLHDFPGQGTALVGVLDPFWDSKGYVAPVEFRRFCGETVPLARVLKRVWTYGETFSADVEVCHFGPAPLKQAEVYWTLESGNGRNLSDGHFQKSDLKQGAGIKVGRITWPITSRRDQSKPLACRLVVGIAGTPFENDWPIWIYPPSSATLPAPPTRDVLVSTTLDPAAKSTLASGGKVVLLLENAGPQNPKLTFEPIFWNRYMFNTQSRQTLGLVCDPDHPALAEFPTSFHSDWQWAQVFGKGRALVLTCLPGELQPIIQVIDDWNTNRKLGVVFECRVGRGRLLVCSADLSSNLDQRPAAAQLRRSLLAYAGSDRFRPKLSVDPDALESTVAPSGKSTLASLGARVILCSSEDTANGNVAANAMDGDPQTFWHTRWTPQNDPMPHELVIDLGRDVSVKGIRYQPRLENPNGRIAECEFYFGSSTNSWQAPVATARWPGSEEPQTLLFAQPSQARYLRLLIKSEANNNPFASIAELDVVTEGSK